MDNVTSTASAGPLAGTEWLTQFLSESSNAPVIAALTASFASFGVLSFCAVIPYCFRLCRGHDVITRCIIGKSVLTLSIDSTGNGLHAAQMLVVDTSKRTVKMESTGMSDSPELAHATPPGFVENPLPPPSANAKK